MDVEEIAELVRLREAAKADYDAATNDLRVALVDALTAGEVSELGAHKLTGVARSVIRTWVGKT